MSNNIAQKKQLSQFSEQLKKVLLLFVLLIFLSCNKKKFSKERWNEQGDLHEYPNRKDIIDDLLTNYKLLGLSFDTLVGIIGPPDDKIIMSTENEIFYPIETKYELFGVDPVYTKILAITLTTDSIVENYRMIGSKKP